MTGPSAADTLAGNSAAWPCGTASEDNLARARKSGGTRRRLHIRHPGATHTGGGAGRHPCEGDRVRGLWLRPSPLARGHQAARLHPRPRTGRPGPLDGIERVNRLPSAAAQRGRSGDLHLLHPVPPLLQLHKGRIHRLRLQLPDVQVSRGIPLLPRRLRRLLLPEARDLRLQGRLRSFRRGSDLR